MIPLVRVSLLEAVTVVSGFVAFSLHLVGTIFPQWWVLHEHDTAGLSITYYYGIWKVVECRNDTCIDLPSDMHDKRAWLIGPAVLLILADLLLCAVVVFTVLYLIKPSLNPLYRKLCVLFSGGAGGVIILAVLIFYKKKAGLRPSAAPETTEGDPGWTLFLSTFGGILGIVNAILLGIVVNRKYKMARRLSIFGIKNVAEMEIDVNALRRGELIQGENINKVDRLPKVPSVSKVSSNYI